MQLEQLQHAHGLAGGSHHPQVTVWCDQHESSCADVEHFDATVGKQGQQVHHVEVGDERVGQLHQRPGEHRFSRHGISSHGSALAVQLGRDSPRCYNRGWSAHRRRPRTGGLTTGGPLASRIEAQRSGDHVLGDLSERTAVAEGVGPQSDERFGDADVELGGDHAGGLVHHIVEVGAGLQRGGQLPGRRVRLQHEDCLGGHVGHHQHVGVLVVGERPRSVAVQIERPETHRSHLKREAEDGPHARLDGRPGEGEPPGPDGFSQIRFEDGPVLVVGVDARPLPELVLQLLDRGRSPCWWCKPSLVAHRRTSA